MFEIRTMESSRLRTWLKRIGLAGFLFFLIKGLLWVGVFYGIISFPGCQNT